MSPSPPPQHPEPGTWAETARFLLLVALVWLSVPFWTYSAVYVTIPVGVDIEPPGRLAYGVFWMLSTAVGWACMALLVPVAIVVGASRLWAVLGFEIAFLSVIGLHILVNG